MERLLAGLSLEAPKPVRADLFSQLADNLKASPPRTVRHASPHLDPHKMPSALQLDELDADGVIHDGVLAEYTVSPFLGEEPSVHLGPHPFLLSRSPIPRSRSLESVPAAQAVVMVKMPARRCCGDRELGDAFEALPPHSWILPHILASCPTAVLQHLLALPCLFASTASEVPSSSTSNRPRLASESSLPSLSAAPAPARIASPRMPSTPTPSVVLPPGWVSLGPLLLSRDPAWLPWEPRAVALLDNLLLEHSTSSEGVGVCVSGYAALSGARVSRETYHPRGGVASVGTSSSSSCTAIRVSCSSTSSGELTTTFWLRPPPGATEGVLEQLCGVLVRASGLEVEDVFEVSGGPAGLLGRGRFNEVRRAVRRPQPLQQTPCVYPPVALKLVSKEAFWERVAAGRERADALVREVLAQMLLTLDMAAGGAPVVVQLFSVLETRQGFALELELMAEDDLFDRLALASASPSSPLPPSSSSLAPPHPYPVHLPAPHPPLDEPAIARIVLQLLQAVSMCYAQGLAHRDIKLANITFPRHSNDDSSSPSEYRVKLADLGMAGFVCRDGLLRGRCGTPGYVAPDILHAGRDEPYPLNVDVFSIGVVAYTLLCGYEPFHGDDEAELLAANKAVAFAFHRPDWDDISAQSKDFICRALRPSACDRPSPELAAQHPWIRQHCGHTPRGRDRGPGGAAQQYCTVC